MIQVGEELDGMVMIRSGDNRQGVCPLKFLQEVWQNAPDVLLILYPVTFITNPYLSMTVGSMNLKVSGQLTGWMDFPQAVCWSSSLYSTFLHRIPVIPCPFLLPRFCTFWRKHSIFGWMSGEYFHFLKRMTEGLFFRSLRFFFPQRTLCYGKFHSTIVTQSFINQNKFLWIVF